jgi:hypothetical protein
MPGEPDPDELEKAITGDDPRARHAALEALWKLEIADTQDPGRLIELLEKDTAQNPVDHAVAACLERWLNRASDIPELVPRLEVLALKTIRDAREGPAWKPLAYVVAGAPGCSTPRPVRQRLLSAMLDSPRGEVSVLPEIFAEQATETWVVDTLLNAPGEIWAEMERGLMTAAATSEPFARKLCEHVRQGAPIGDDSPLRDFCCRDPTGPSPLDVGRATPPHSGDTLD